MSLCIGGAREEPVEAGHLEEGATGLHGRVREAGGGHEEVLRGVHGGLTSF